LKNYPAIEVQSTDTDRLLAAIDDFAPTAIEERDDAVRVFFSTTAARDEAQVALGSQFAVAPIEVSDEDWPRRSQENLQPVTVGRITIVPSPPPSAPGPDTIAIRPSMGFGTGHHATTRLCLTALQTLDLSHAFVLDVGTGSGVLAIAAARFGATRALGIDTDADAVQSARENLVLNPEVRGVEFAIEDLRATTLPAADVVTANLTGALLMASAQTLLNAVRRGGTLIASGFLASERDAVVHAFAETKIGWQREEDGWVGIAVKKP